MARPKGNAASNAARRQDILKAAFDVFSKVGYTSGSLSQIAEIVGITEAGILHHFKTKANLLTSVLEYRDEVTTNTIEGFNTDGIGFVKAWLRLVDHNVKVPGLVELFCVVSAEATKENHPAHEFFKNRYAFSIELAKKAMVDLQTNGHISTTANPEDLGRALIALTDGLQLQWLLDRKWDMVEEHKAFFRRIMRDDSHSLVSL